MSNADHIAELQARLDALLAEKAAAEPAPEPARFDFFARSEPEPERAVFYSGYTHPDLAHERILASGHGVGGHPGLAAAVSN